MHADKVKCNKKFILPSFPKLKVSFKQETLKLDLFEIAPTRFCLFPNLLVKTYFILLTTEK